MNKIVELPYYAVIFKSKRTSGDAGYTEMSHTLLDAVKKIEGFLGADSVRDSDGVGITVSYWRTLESIEKWKHDVMHSQGKEMGKKRWYEEYTIRICKVEYENSFPS